MILRRITVHHIALPLRQPFVTPLGSYREKRIVLVSVESESGFIGWGECVAMPTPHYTAETDGTAWHILTQFAAPALLAANPAHPRDVLPILRPICGNPMAKAAIECAMWDLYASEQNLSLHAVIGGVQPRVSVGVSLGIYPDIPSLLQQVDLFVAQGYQRIKLKIQPGWDVAPIRAIQEKFPRLALMADANGSYNLDELPRLQHLDSMGLLLIEQPISAGWDSYARLQAQLQTPLCLDECLQSPNDVREVIRMRACRAVNLKVGRVGGIAPALEIYEMCQAAGIAVWCGGMLESNIGRALNVAIASLAGIIIPGDISASDRYYSVATATPDFSLNAEDSTLTVPTGAGLGVTVVPNVLKRYAVEEAVSFQRN